MTPTRLSHELRNETSPDLARRRWIIGLSLIGVAIGKVVGLYQTGIIKHLPDPPLDIFDSDKVDASDYAYRYGSTPDAFGMLINYGITAALAAAGGKDRAEDKPALSLALSAKALGDTALNIVLATQEYKENKKLCFYCQLATVVSAATFVLTLPETIRAIQRNS